MSKYIAASAIDGAIEWVAKADAKLNEAIAAKGESCPVALPNTAYYLPVIYAFTGEKMQTLADLRSMLAKAKELLPARPADKVWLPYLGNTLDAGVAALFACEIIEACKYLIGPNPVEGIWLGAASDVIMRERGIEFVDGSAPGFAAITGAAPTNEIAVKIAKELQQKNLYVFMGGCTNGKQFAQQLAEEGVQLGWETRLVPFGADVSALIYALGFANRAAMSFGGVKPGDFAANLRYNKDRIFAFVLAFGEVTPDKYAAAAGAINYGFPVISDTDIPQILPTGVCTYEHVVSQVPYETMVEKALEVRGCKIKITKVPIPVPYGAAFEGERIRKADVQVEFGGNRTTAFEFVTSVEMGQINDGEIEIIGPDIDQVAEGTAMPLAIWVEAAGRKMQSDFEPILERQIHHLLNGAEGLWHMGQRDIIWTRISKNGFKKGLRLKHYGEILHAKLLSDYPAIVDKIKVTMITDSAEVEKRVAVARKVYDERNRRLESMTDESVDTFYSCTLCQSFAPDHVCVITPERLGLCGAYNWLDGKAAFEIDETGPNQPVSEKGRADFMMQVKGRDLGYTIVSGADNIAWQIVSQGNLRGIYKLDMNRPIAGSKEDTRSLNPINEVNPLALLQKFRPQLGFVTEGVQELGSRQLYRLIGKPKVAAMPGQVQIGSLQAWIALDDGFLHRITINDLRGNAVLTIDLSAVRFNLPLDDTLFVFTPPPNANIQDLNARLGSALK